MSREVTRTSGALRERRRIIEALAQALGELRAMGAHCLDNREDYADVVEYVADRVFGDHPDDAQRLIDSALEAGQDDEVMP